MTKIAEAIRTRKEDNLPESIRQRDVAKAFYGVLRETLTPRTANGDLRQVAADAAVRIDDIIVREKIVSC